MYFEDLVKRSHKYQALREAYCAGYRYDLSEDEAVDKYGKSYAKSLKIEDDVILKELVSSSMEEYENMFGTVEE